MGGSEYANQNFGYNTLLSGRLIPTFDLSATLTSSAAIDSYATFDLSAAFASSAAIGSSSTFDLSAIFASSAAIGIASIYCSELDSVALRRRDVPIAAADDFVCDFQSLRPAQPDYRYRT